MITKSSALFDGLVEWLTEVYGPEIGPFLARRIATVIRRCGDENLDNFRACETTREDEVERYAKQRAGGCCGTSDTTITHYPSGRTFKLGFNYGH